MAIKNRFAELHDEIRAWRQDFHQHPEIMFEMHRTSGVVENFLKDSVFFMLWTGDYEEPRRETNVWTNP